MSTTPSYPYTAHEHKRCGAKNRQGNPCKNWGMANGRCKFHGGKSLTGMANPAYKHGRYSKYLPARLLDRYEIAANDKELLAMREDIALVDSRLADLLTRVDTGEAGKLWAKAKQILDTIALAIATGNGQLVTAQVADLSAVTAGGLADYAAWEEISNALEQRRRLVETERKRLVDMQQMITSEQAVLLIGAIVDIIRTHVTDRQTLQAITLDFGKLLNQSTDNRAIDYQPVDG